MGAVLDVRRFRGNVHDHLVAVGRRTRRRVVVQVGLGDRRESVGTAAGDRVRIRRFRGNVVVAFGEVFLRRHL